MTVETGITEESVIGTGNNLKHPLSNLFGSKDAIACLLDVHLLVLLLSLQIDIITPVTDMLCCLGSGRRRGTGTGIEKRRGAQKSQRPGMRPTTGERRSRWVVISSLHSLLSSAAPVDMSQAMRCPGGVDFQCCWCGLHLQAGQFITGRKSNIAHVLINHSGCFVLVVCGLDPSPTCLSCNSLLNPCIVSTFGNLLYCQGVQWG